MIGLTIIVSGCKQDFEEEKTFLERMIEIINLHDGAIYHMFDDKSELYDGVNSVYIIDESFDFVFEHEFSIIVVDAELNSDRLTVEILNNLYSALELDDNIIIMFVNFSDFGLFSGSEFFISGRAHDSWALVTSNFSSGFSLDISGVDEEVKVRVGVIGEFGETILEHVEKE